MRQESTNVTHAQWHRHASRRLTPGLTAVATGSGVLPGSAWRTTTLDGSRAATPYRRRASSTAQSRDDVPDLRRRDRCPRVTLPSLERDCRAKAVESES